MIHQIKEFALQSGVTQTELIKLWMIKGLSESKHENNKKSLNDLANTITLPYRTDSVEMANKLAIGELWIF